MGVYVYAVCEAGASPPSVEGIPPESLRVVTADGLGALVRDREEVQSTIGEDELWEHERIVEGLMANRDLLPARFGSVVDSDLSVRALLRERNSQLRSALDRVAGSIELGVRAVWSGSAPQADVEGLGTGSAYLAARLEAHRRARELCERLERGLRAISSESRVDLLRSANMPFSGAYLVPRERTEEFRRRVSELDEGIPEAEIICTGPWPAYSFAEPRERE